MGRLCLPLAWIPIFSALFVLSSRHTSVTGWVMCAHCPRTDFLAFFIVLFHLCQLCDRFGCKRGVSDGRLSHVDFWDNADPAFSRLCLSLPVFFFLCLFFSTPAIRYVQSKPQALMYFSMKVLDPIIPCFRCKIPANNFFLTGNHSHPTAHGQMGCESSSSDCERFADVHHTCSRQAGRRSRRVLEQVRSGARRQEA